MFGELDTLWGNVKNCELELKRLKRKHHQGLKGCQKKYEEWQRLYKKWEQKEIELDNILNYLEN